MWWTLSISALAADWTPSPSYSQAAHALSARDGGVDCAAVEAMATDGVALLRELVDHAQAPSWIPMRAADCLVTRHAVEVEPDMLAWIADEERQGLAWLALDRLASMPEDLAVRLAQATLATSPNLAPAKRRIARAQVPAVQALLEAP